MESSLVASGNGQGVGGVTSGPLGPGTWVLFCVQWEPQQSRAVNCALPAPVVRSEWEGQVAEVMCTEGHSKAKG